MVIQAVISQVGGHQQQPKKTLTKKPSRKGHENVNGELRQDHIFQLVITSHFEKIKQLKFQGLCLFGTDRDRLLLLPLVCG